MGPNQGQTGETYCSAIAAIGQCLLPASWAPKRRLGQRIGWAGNFLDPQMATHYAQGRRSAIRTGMWTAVPIGATCLTLVDAAAGLSEGKATYYYFAAFQAAWACVLMLADRAVQSRRRPRTVVAPPTAVVSPVTSPRRRRSFDAGHEALQLVTVEPPLSSAPLFTYVSGATVALCVRALLLFDVEALGAAAVLCLTATCSVFAQALVFREKAAVAATCAALCVGGHVAGPADIARLLGLVLVFALLLYAAWNEERTRQRLFLRKHAHRLDWHRHPDARRPSHRTEPNAVSELSPAEGIRAIVADLLSEATSTGPSDELTSVAVVPSDGSSASASSPQTASEAARLKREHMLCSLEEILKLSEKAMTATAKAADLGKMVAEYATDEQTASWAKQMLSSTASVLTVDRIRRNSFTGELLSKDAALGISTEASLRSAAEAVRAVEVSSAGFSDAMLNEWSPNLFEVDASTNGNVITAVFQALVRRPANAAMLQELNVIPAAVFDFTALLDREYSRPAQSAFAPAVDVRAAPSAKTVKRRASFNGEKTDVGAQAAAAVADVMATQSNPYHNNVHGADVLHSVHWLSNQPVFLGRLQAVERLGVYLAAAAHDFRHPGRSNLFMATTGSELAVLYSDDSVLERMHTAQTWSALCSRPRCLPTSSEKRLQLRKVMISVILATDLSHSGRYLAEFGAATRNFASSEALLDDASARLTVLNVLVKCADIAHPIKLLPIHLRWSKLIVTEFLSQGDEERSIGIPISPLCDRDNFNLPSSQKGFIQFVTKPSLDVVVDFIANTDMDAIADLLDSNFLYWSKAADTPGLTNKQMLHAAVNDPSGFGTGRFLTLPQKAGQRLPKSEGNSPRPPGSDDSSLSTRRERIESYGKSPGAEARAADPESRRVRIAQHSSPPAAEPRAIGAPGSLDELVGTGSPVRTNKENVVLGGTASLTSSLTATVDDWGDDSPREELT